MKIYTVDIWQGTDGKRKRVDPDQFKALADAMTGAQEIEQMRNTLATALEFGASATTPILFIHRVVGETFFIPPAP
jgi:hypothetical protein